MRLRDFQKAEEFGVIHCPVRHLCPVGCVCGLGDTERFEGGDKIMPAVVEYRQGRPLVDRPTATSTTCSPSARGS